MLFVRTNYIRVLIYLKAIYGQEMTVVLKCFTKSFIIKIGISCLIERSPPIKTQLEHYHTQKGILTDTIKKR